MVSPSTAGPQKVTISSGEVVSVNETVYVAPSWGGQPFGIARVIEFLPVPRNAKGGLDHSRAEVKLAGYYRPEDVGPIATYSDDPPSITSRAFTDRRVLFAAINSSVRLVSDIRGKCYVRHKDQIEDLTKWKQKPDHFFYNKFFDPYIKRELEVVSVSLIRNLPTKVLETLKTRYQYIIAEREAAAELTDTYQTCSVCNDWSSSLTAVRCDSCHKGFHMHCLSPPLLTKPAKGYSWACAPCARKHDRDVNSHAATAPQKVKVPTIPTVKYDKERDEKGTITTYKGWPYRYFGIHTVAEDTLDPDYPIFPRSASRIGKNFQCVVEEELDESHDLVPKSSTVHSSELPERGGDSTLRLLSRPVDGLEDYMNAVKALKLPIPTHNLGVINRAVELYTRLPRAKALEQMKRSTSAELEVVTFTPSEVDKMAVCAEERGGLDTHLASKADGRTPAENSRYYRVWREEQLKLMFEGMPKLSSSRSTAIGPAPPSPLASSTLEADSVHNPAIDKGAKLVCDACATRTSKRWWKIPRSVGTGFWCEQDGQTYLKYAYVPRQDSARMAAAIAAAGEKREGTPLGAPSKRQKVAASSTTAASTSTNSSTVRATPCSCCNHSQPADTMIICSNCTIRVHTGCAGIPPESRSNPYRCDQCANLETLENRLDPHCIFCPPGKPPNPLNKSHKKSLYPDEPNYLQTLKPTAGAGNWAHVLCSVFVPGVRFTDSSVYAKVEGIHLVEKEAWEGICSICSKQGGAVIKCNDCPKVFHVACGMSKGYRFGFEISLVKSSRKDIIVAQFKEESGQMRAAAFCNEHDLKDRVIYAPQHLDRNLGQTALQVYASLYKQAPQTESFPLLQKAEVLDFLLQRKEAEENAKVKELVDEKPRFCSICKATFTPMWAYRAIDVWECWRCHVDDSRKK
ncbi:hypothetical protein BDY24DRAFT_414071 [Mrakia frigida]|uniref:uncharacterized protein n=1 Tax=Mrakia frigida TaxID=29902 RepID=UPI003FCC05D4